MAENRRVVVTGLGVVSPVGSSMETAWNNLVSGYNGIGPITYFDTTNYKAKLGAQVQGFDPMQYMDHGCNAVYAREAKKHVTRARIETIGGINEPDMADRQLQKDPLRCRKRHLIDTLTGKQHLRGGLCRCRCTAAGGITTPQALLVPV